MRGSGTERPGGTASGRLRRAVSWPRRAWVIGFVILNAVAVLVLAGVGSAHTLSCGGGFSGYSGGGGNCSADLSIKAIAAPAAVPVQGRIFYLMEVTNNGPDPSGFAQVLVHVQHGVEVDWFMASQEGYCSYQSLVVSCFFYGGIQPHQRIAATVVIRAPLAGTIKATGTVTSDTPDPNPANNTGTAKTKVG